MLSKRYSICPNTILQFLATQKVFHLHMKELLYTLHSTFYDMSNCKDRGWHRIQNVFAEKAVFYVTDNCKDGLQTTTQTCPAITLVFGWSSKTALALVQEGSQRYRYTTTLWKGCPVMYGPCLTAWQVGNTSWVPASTSTTTQTCSDIILVFGLSLKTLKSRSGQATTLRQECWVIHWPCLICVEYDMSYGFTSNHTPVMVSYHPGFLIKLEKSPPPGSKVV